jgi:hypothetical protein
MNIDTLSELLTKVSSKIRRKLSAGEIKKFPDFYRENIQYTTNLSDLVTAYVKEINLVESFTVSPTDINKLDSTTDKLDSTTDKLDSTTDKLDSTTDKLDSTTDNAINIDNKTEESTVVDPITAYENDLQSAQSNELVPRVQYSNRDTSINISSFLGIDTFEKLIRELNPKVSKKKAYVCLDSRYARFLNNCTKLQWDYSNALITTDNSTSVIGNVRNITSVRMLSMVVRKFTSVAQRASICIEEFSAQAFILPNGRRFHFIGLLNDLQNNSIAIDYRAASASQLFLYVPDFTTYDKYELIAGYKFNDGIYRFNKPITDLNTFTISIGDPFSPVTIPKYEFFDVSLYYYFSSDFGFRRVRLTFNEPHFHIGSNYFVSDLVSYPDKPNILMSVFIDGLVSSSPTDDFIVNILNTTEFTLTQIIDAYTMDVYITPAGLLKAGKNSMPGFSVTLGTNRPLNKARVRINSYRVIMNFELDYIAE